MKLRKNERQQRILTEFRSSPSVRIGDLAILFGVTKETIRRDIDELSNSGLLARTYGGAVAPPMNYEPRLIERTKVNQERRRRMAALTARIVEDCNVLMIDTGATMAHVCEQLSQTVPRSGEVELTVITNSLTNTTTLSTNPSIRVIICPGTYDEREAAAFGPQTIEFISRFNADAFLSSGGGISADGITDANSEAVAIKRAMLARCARSLFVMEAAKFSAALFERVCPLHEISELVTDEPIVPDLSVALATAKVKVHVAGTKERDEPGQRAQSAEIVPHV
jgi:DeoR family transcriptional regulator, glycerol-3-phosphate regulon repressor